MTRTWYLGTRYLVSILYVQIHNTAGLELSPFFVSFIDGVWWVNYLLFSCKIPPLLPLLPTAPAVFSWNSECWMKWRVEVDVFIVPDCWYCWYWHVHLTFTLPTYVIPGTYLVRTHVQQSYPREVIVALNKNYQVHAYRIFELCFINEYQSSTR